MARFINKSFELPLYQQLFKMNRGQWLFPVSNGRMCISSVRVDLKGKSKGRAGIKE